ncbi:MAG: hypothetical protein AMXMBFR59_11840 [Rhodanobacteraceae bacterium]
MKTATLTLGRLIAGGLLPCLGLAHATEETRAPRMTWEEERDKDSRNASTSWGTPAP